MITLRQIEVFRAVMQAKTAVAAASQLRISQPTVTKTLARLEKLLELRLFDRSSGRIVPTIEAQRLLAEINTAYTDLESAVTRAARAARSGEGLFRVGAQPSLARNLAPRALARLTNAAPDLSVHLDVLPVTEVMGYLRDGPGECAVTIFPVVSAGLVSVELGSASVVAVVPLHYGVATATAPLTAREVVEWPIITFEPHAIHARATNEFFAESGIQPFKTHMVRFADAAVGMAEAGLGIAILDEFSALSADLTRVAVKPLAFDGRLRIFLHRSVHRPQSRFLALFENALRATFDAAENSMP